MWKLLVAIAAAGMLALAQPAFAADGSCPARDFARQAKATLEAFAPGFSGAVLVALDGKPVLRQAVGPANREWNIANTPETKFRLGSITKQFTATAILQLAEQGKLTIDDPVSRYYPAAPPSWSRITIKQLLTHTSGIPDYPELAGFDGHDERFGHTPEQLIESVRDKPLQFEPGAQFAYDNTGYVLLGYIVEKLSGQSYAQYLQTHVFGPLGMRDTGYDVGETIMPRRAAGYALGSEGWVNAAPVDMSTPFSAGGLYSTIGDLLIWDQALYAGKALSAASQAAMFADYGHRYGFGWWVRKQWGHDIIWHGGGINGFSNALQRYPQDRMTVVVLSNSQTSPSAKLATDLAGLCFGAPVYPHEVSLPGSLLDRYAGSYAATPDFVVHVERKGNRLQTQATRGMVIPIYAKDASAFYAKLTGAEFVFQTDAAGQVTGLTRRQGGRDQVLRRMGR